MRAGGPRTISGPFRPPFQGDWALPGHSYADLVNVPSTEEPTLDRVKPGDPANSFLVIHLQNDGDGAPASDIPFIIQWITDGAPPASAAMPMDAERIREAGTL